jgi:hypothetical protein
MFVIISCKKEKYRTPSGVEFDIILVIGQSNTHQGIGFDFNLDSPRIYIKQLGRHGENNFKIIPATEPLDHVSKLSNNIGFALTFAKQYSFKHLQPNHELLIIPCGMGQTGFANNFWNVGDTLYNDALTRTNYVLNKYKSKLVAVLWHQGENDIFNTNYQATLDSMITNLRKDIVGNNNDVPFILGGMVPYWSNQDTNRIKHNNVIANTPLRINKTGYADPRIPFVITKPDNEYFSIHFDAAGQREMGLRYFSAFQQIAN